MKLLCRRTLDGLQPIDETGETDLRKIKLGAVVKVEVKRARNVKMHRLYWRLVNTVFENQEHYENIDQLHNALKIAAGVYETLTMPNGVTYKVPGSIAFDEMDDVKFKEFWNRVCDLVCSHFLPGLQPGVLKTEIESMVGLAA